MLRKTLLNIHMYGGLLCFSYLILFGVSTLNFNHPFGFTKSAASVTSTYHARFVRPGTEYSVDVHPGTGSATVTRTRTGVWAIIRDLHGSYTVYPESRLAGSWKWYTEMCAYVLIFAAISGVYLWAGRCRRRRIGLVLLGAAGVVSVSLMLLVTYHG